MKVIKNLFISSVLVSAFVFSACEGDKGDVGPKGDPGPAGENGVDGINGEDGNTTSFYFQNGYKGYEGTQDIALTNNPDAFATPPTAEGLTLYSLMQENFDDPSMVDSAISVLKFDKLKEVVEQEYGTDFCSEEFFINEAVLYLSGVYATQGLEAYLQVGVLGEASPLFEEATATWELANSSAPWNSNGAAEQWAYNDILLTSLGLVNIGYIHSLEASNDVKTMLHQPFYIPGAVVKQWLCEAGANKGLRLAVHNNHATVFMYSSEVTEQEMRPMLYINIDKSKNEQNSRANPEEDYKNWSMQSYEEKMAPFYKLYPNIRAH